LQLLFVTIHSADRARHERRFKWFAD
jgi:hypothetical protein